MTTIDTLLPWFYFKYLEIILSETRVWYGIQSPSIESAIICNCSQMPIGIAIPSSGFLLIFSIFYFQHYNFENVSINLCLVFCLVDKGLLIFCQFVAQIGVFSVIVWRMRCWRKPVIIVVPRCMLHRRVHRWRSNQHSFQWRAVPAHRRFLGAWT